MDDNKKQKMMNNVKLWRLNNTDKYNEYQRNYYKKAMENDEQRIKFNERCRINSQRLRDKKSDGIAKKKRGRPQKKVTVISISNIPL
jgi:hypothetical protein